MNQIIKTPKQHFSTQAHLSLRFLSKTICRYSLTSFSNNWISSFALDNSSSNLPTICLYLNNSREISTSRALLYVISSSHDETLFNNRRIISSPPEDVGGSIHSKKSHLWGVRYLEQPRKRLPLFCGVCDVLVAVGIPHRHVLFGSLLFCEDSEFIFKVESI